MMPEPRLEFLHTSHGVAARRIRRGQGKGRPPPRPCPDDFDVIFVEVGRIDCEPWYRASRRTINRWLEERGKQRLIDLRAAYVRHLRRQLHKGKARPHADAVMDHGSVDPGLAHLAAEFLRSVRNGGWRISVNPVGGWRVGISIRTSAELVAMAERKGFDVRAAQRLLEIQMKEMLHG